MKREREEEEVEPGAEQQETSEEETLGPG